MSRPPLWQLLVTGGYVLVSIAAIAYHRDEPFWMGLHALSAAVSVIGVLWPRTWLVAGAVAVAATMWGGWEWARIFTTWIQPESPIAYSTSDLDAALDHTWEITIVTLWLNILVMMVWVRRKPDQREAA